MIKAALFAFAIVAGSQNDGVIRSEYDMLEVNHVYRENGAITFDQVIFWNWHRHRKMRHAHGWMIMKDCRDFTDGDHRRSWETLFRVNERRSITAPPPPSYQGKFVGGPMMPTYDCEQMRWVFRFSKNGKRFEVTSKVLMETHTPYDPEANDRAEFPAVKRTPPASQSTQSN